MRYFKNQKEAIKAVTAFVKDGLKKSPRSLEYNAAYLLDMGGKSIEQLANWYDGAMYGKDMGMSDQDLLRDLMEESKKSKYIMEKHIPSFEEFVNEAYADNVFFDWRKTKHIKFILGSSDHFDYHQGDKTFYIDFTNRKSNVSRKDLEKKIMDAINKEAKKSKSLTNIKKEFVDSEYHTTVLALSNLKGNYNGLTFAFKALDDLYGEYGDGIGWLHVG